MTSSKPMLTQADFTYLGAMRMPDIGATGVNTEWAPSGLTGRKVGGKVHLFVYSVYGSDIYEVEDTGTYNTNYSSSDRMPLVAKWTDPYHSKRLSYDQTTGAALPFSSFTLGNMGGLYFNETTQALYWTFYDNYNVGNPRPDWNLGFTTLDNPATGASTAYGPFRTKSTDSQGTFYGARRCMTPWASPFDGSMMCGATLQSGDTTVPYGPMAIGGVNWPTTGTPSGFNAPDLTFTQRYLMYYSMAGKIDGNGNAGSNKITSMRRSFEPYIFDKFAGDTGNPAVNPALYGGVGSWTQIDVWRGATWLELTNKHAFIALSTLAGSPIQDPNNCNAGHTWYSSGGIGHFNCPHNCAPTGDWTGPVLTSYVPAMIIFNPDDLIAVKNGAKTDYTVDPVSTVDLARTFGIKVAAPGFSNSAMSGFYYDPVRKYLFIAANGADDTSSVGHGTLIHVFAVRD